MDVARASGDEIWTNSDFDREKVDFDVKKSFNPPQYWLPFYRGGV